MNILMIAPSLPYPPASGGALRVYSLLRGLHAAGHHITLLALDDFGYDSPDTELSDLCANIETFRIPRRSKSQRLKTLLTTPQADLAHRLFSADLAKRLHEILSTERFDLIQCEALETACYLPITKAAQPSAKLCLDTFNAEYHLQRVIAGIDAREPKRWSMAVYSWIQAGRIANYERQMCALSDIVIAVSPEDADLLRPFRADGRVHILPSAISVDDYASHPQMVDLGAHALVFTGKMDYRPNVDAALWLVNDILPLIRGRVPDVTVTLVGQQPSTRLNILSNIRGVVITGGVTSVVPYLSAAAVYVAPLRMGSGTRLKLLEAMAAGSPIVATTAAAAGLMPDAKAAMLIADGAQAFADAVIGLLTRPDKRADMIQAGKIAVRAHYDWSATAPALLKIYEEHGLV